MLMHAFNTLKDRTANVDQLIGAYLDFDKHLGEIEKSQSQKRKRCVALKQMMMTGENPEDYQKARSELEELVIEIEAVRDAMQTIEAVLANRIPIENADLIKKTAAEIQELRVREQAAIKQFLEMVAKAVAFKETIYGRPLTVIPMSDGPKVFDDFPVPGIRSQAERGILALNKCLRQDVPLDDEMERFYLARVQKARDDLGAPDNIDSIEKQQGELQKKYNQLCEEKEINPQVAVEKRIELARKAQSQKGTKIQAL